MLDTFKRGDRTVGDIIELMAGGAELQSLLSKSEQMSLRT
jgi:hypothetical protein